MIDGLLRRVAVRLLRELPAREVHQVVEGVFAGTLANLGVDDLAPANEDASTRRLRRDFQQTGVPRETFHLQNVLQAYPTQDATKALLWLELDQLIEASMHAPPFLGRTRFLKVELCALT